MFFIYLACLVKRGEETVIRLAEEVLDALDRAVVLAHGLVHGDSAPHARLEAGGAVELKQARALALHQNAATDVATPSLVLHA
jgi:hypothetical protein